MQTTNTVRQMDGQTNKMFIEFIKRSLSAGRAMLIQVEKENSILC